MKRFLTLIVAVCAFFAASAQNPMVTLSHNGELSFFTNITALNSAVDSAKNGDILYLSDGDFVLQTGMLTIKKRLSIVGNGYKTHILGDLEIDMSNNPNSVINEPLFDGLRLDKLSFRGSTNSETNLGESEIRRCWIRTLEYGGSAGKMATYDQCYIEDARFSSYSVDNTILVKNSKICGTGKSSSDYISKISAINCNISNAYSYPLSMISCIFMRRDESEPAPPHKTCSIINSVLDFNPTISSVYVFDCYLYNGDSQSLLDENLDCPLDLKELGYLGEDGSIVGIMGGDTPFSENPSVPSVDSANSSVEYDAENNKLKVSITVKAD